MGECTLIYGEGVQAIFSKVISNGNHCECVKSFVRLKKKKIFIFMAIVSQHINFLFYPFDKF